jgi:hypothetical protein
VAPGLASWETAGPGICRLLRQAPCRCRSTIHEESTMSAGELEIHTILQRLLREGYNALTLAQRRVLERFMAVC